MYIRRKVFSILVDEMGEERLYSVNETLLEGYEVEEEREFAEKVEPKTDKLRVMDEVEYVLDKHLTPKQLRKIAKTTGEGKVRKSIVEGGKVFLPVGAVVGGVTGGIATKSLKGAAKGAAAGAGIGTAVTVGNGLGALGVKARRKLSPRYEEMADRRIDQLKMANGEMSKKEFKKKHYNKKRINRLDEE